MAEYTKLTERLGRVFSKYIRQRDANELGNIKCPLCTRIDLPWREMACCHYIKRRYMETRWDERNAIGGCRHCNSLDETDPQVHHRLWVLLSDRFGEKTMSELAYSKNLTAKFTRSELLEKIKYYQQKIKEL